MPLAPRPTACERCKRFRVIVKAELICEACGYKKNVKESDVDKFPTRWPYHYDEFMSLRCRNRCENCGDEIRLDRVTRTYPNIAKGKRCFVANPLIIG